MLELAKIAEAVATDRPTHLSENGATLTVGLPTDRLGRDRWLVIEGVKPDEGAEVDLFQLRHLYPFPMENPETTGDLLRSLLLLNRVTTFGHHGICEESACLYYVFTWPNPPSIAAMREVVSLVDALTEWHGDLLGRVCAGGMVFADVMADLDEKGAMPRPIVYSGMMPAAM